MRQKYAEERAKRLRSDTTSQFQELEGAFSDFARDPNADPAFTRDPLKEDVDVVIVGGGFAGLLTGARLREKGIQSLRIVEKGADFGGTWYWNRYPGAACDVESYIYLPLLEETGYVPTEKYTRGPEIYAYCRMLAKRFDLYRSALFQTEAHAVHWNEQRKRWTVSTSRGDALQSRFIVSCTGILSTPKLPGIPGIETFQARTFHSSRWDYDYTGGDERGNMTRLEDKVVGIIGTGSSGIQVIPRLGASAAHLYVFQRTPSSVDPRGNKPTDTQWFKSLAPGWQTTRMQNFTVLTSGGSADVDLVDDGWTDIVRGLAPPGLGDGMFDPTELEVAQLKKMELARRRVAEIVADPVTAEALKPYYHYFCKRPGFHDEYLQTFNRPNVTLVDTKGKGVERITRNGAVVAGREFTLDCLIFATGFEYLANYTREFGIDVVGPSGRRLSEHWREGARTLYGVQTDGFPNFFLVSLVQAGAAINYMMTASAQVKHIAHVIDQCRQGGIETIQPTREAVSGWVGEIIDAAKGRRAFLDKCTPGYYNFEGKTSQSFGLNEFYLGPPLEYIARLARWQGEGGFPYMEVTREGIRKCR
jgi:cyclohexanone monooxygenase